MTPDAIRLRPEVEELVREIARRPDSTLLRVPRAASVYCVAGELGIVRESEPGLSSAERHLLAVYREDVAFALRRMAWSRLCLDAQPNDRIVLRHTPDSRAPDPDVLGAGRAVKRALDDAPSGVVEDATIRLLRACVEPSQSSVLGVVELCAAAQRLAPSFQARHNAAIWFTQKQRIQAATVLIRRALLTATDRTQTAFGWQLVGQLAQKSNDWYAAARSSRHAINSQPELVEPYIALAWSAVHTDDLGSARDGMRQLRQLIGKRIDLIDEHRARFESMARDTERPVSRTVRTTLRRLVDGSESLAGELFHAIA